MTKKQIAQLRRAAHLLRRLAGDLRHEYWDPASQSYRVVEIEWQVMDMEDAARALYALAREMKAAA